MSEAGMAMLHVEQEYLKVFAKGPTPRASALVVRYWST